MKTIYNTYVKMESQEQCDRMKQLCIDNGLKIWDDEVAFEFYSFRNNCLFIGIDYQASVFLIVPENKQKITEQEFIKLLQDEQENK